MDMIINPFEDDEEEKKRIQAQLRNVGTRVQAGTKSDEINSNFAVDIDAESSFGDLWQAQVGYQYDPILESAYRWHKYRNAEQDPNFNALSSMDGYEGHESSLVVARNQEEEDDIKRAIDENRDRRATMSEFGFGANLVAGILDPINLLAVPFAGAGFVTAGARSMGGLIARRGLATGAGVGITQVGLEAIRAPFDPENTEGEVLLNVGMATIAGTIIGGAVSIPAARRMNVTAKTIIHQQQVKKALDETILDDLDTLDAGDGINKAKRKHGAETKETLNAANEILPKKMEKLKSRINEMKDELLKTPEGKAIWDEWKEVGEVSPLTLSKLNDVQKKTLLGDEAVDGPEFLYHGTNEKTTFPDGINPVNDMPIRGRRTLDRYIDEKQNLIIKATPDDFVGNKQIGVSLTSDMDNAISYTGAKDIVFGGKRDPNSVGGDDAIVFKIKSKALPSNKRSEAMGETVVMEDIKIAKGDYEIIRFGKHAKEQDLDKTIPNLGIINLVKSYMKSKKSHQEIESEINLRTIEDARNNKSDAFDGYKIADSWFTNNWFYTKFLATPFKSIVQGKYPNAIKKYMYDLASDSGVANMANKLGISKGNSVYQMAAMRNGEWVKALDQLMGIFGRATNQGERKFMDIAGGPQGFEAWAKNINKKYINKEQLLNDAEKEAHEVMAKFWTTWGERLEDVGLIGNKVFFQKQLLYKDLQVRELDEEIKIMEVEKYEFTNVLKSLYEQERRFLVLQESQGLSFKQIDSLKKIQNDIDNFALPRKNPFQKDWLFKKYKGLLRKRARLNDEINVTKQQLDEAQPMKSKNDDVMFARYWDREAITANRPQLEKILYDWFEKNPSVTKFIDGKFVTKDTSLNPIDITQRAKNAVDQIMGIAEKDVTGENVQYYGMGKSKHFKHRQLDIPNKLVFDFIVNDPMAVMKAYTTRVAPRYEFAMKHNNKKLDEIMEDIDIEMYGKGFDTIEVDKVRMNYQHMYDRVVGSVMRKDPSSWDMMAVKVMRDAAQLNYLGSAGFSTLPDMAKILMEHDMPVIRAVLKDVYSGDKRIKMNMEEGRIAGEILDIVTGSSHLRMTEELANNPFSKGFYDKYADKTKNAFYIANLLAPATRIFKQMDSMARVHTLIDLAVRKHNNNYLAAKQGNAQMKDLTQFEVTYASRYNIDEKISADIFALVENGTIEKTNNGLYIGNTEKWPTEMQGTVDNFRASLNSGILNTVLMGTPADKPIIVDGVFYVPMRIAKQLGLEEDSVVRGYHRIESPLLGMPFQFMSYSFAAMNKITAGIATDQIRNRKTALAMAMGMGYLSLWIKTSVLGSQYSWDNMDWEDRIARSFDNSGIASLISDMFYMSLAVSNALGGPNLSGGLIEQKGPKNQEPDIMNALTEIGGAGTGITHDFFRKGLAEFVTGNFGEGSKHMIRNFPLMRLWFLKGFMNDMTKDLGGGNTGRTDLTTSGGRF